MYAERDAIAIAAALRRAAGITTGGGPGTVTMRGRVRSPIRYGVAGPGATGVVSPGKSGAAGPGAIAPVAPGAIAGGASPPPGAGTEGATPGNALPTL